MPATLRWTSLLLRKQIEYIGQELAFLVIEVRAWVGEHILPRLVLVLPRFVGLVLLQVLLRLLLKAVLLLDALQQARVLQQELFPTHDGMLVRRRLLRLLQRVLCRRRGVVLRRREGRLQALIQSIRVSPHTLAFNQIYSTFGNPYHSRLKTCKLYALSFRSAGSTSTAPVKSVHLTHLRRARLNAALLQGLRRLCEQPHFGGNEAKLQVLV